MIFRAPMPFFCNGHHVGTAVTYGYETPWATGRFEATDARVAAVGAFLEWAEQLDGQELPDEEADARYDRELVARGLSQLDVQAYTSGPWVVVTPDGAAHEIAAPRLDAEGWATWRW